LIHPNNTLDLSLVHLSVHLLHFAQQCCLHVFKFLILILEELEIRVMQIERV
jgi:hypothetical protein